jgi:hypothetical protein
MPLLFRVDVESLRKIISLRFFYVSGFDTLNRESAENPFSTIKQGRSLSSTTNPYFDRAKSQTSLQEKIELAIPGFHGYKEKELRRESDKLIRNQIYQKLSDAESQAKDTYRSLVNQGANDSWDDTDHLLARLDRVMERINHSEYGYAGFFDVTKVKDPDLDRMMTYDMQLIQMADNVSIAIQALKDSVDNNRLLEAKGKVGDATKAVDALENAYNGRKQIIVGVQ